MEHTVEKLSSNKVKISFKAPAADFEEAVEKAYLKMRRSDQRAGLPQGQGSAQADRADVRRRRFL